MAYKILKIIGYSRIKKNLKHHVFRRKIKKEDTHRKLEVRDAINTLSGIQLRKNGDESDIIVSLTSYGLRVNDTLPYTLYSLLQQTLKPNRIIVWLDNVNWDNNNLPEILKKLQSLGVEFFFVPDIRSYKKLIPALKMFPDNVIITVDDDCYYNERTIEWLLSCYSVSDQKTIIGTWGFSPSISGFSYNKYSSWKIETDTNKTDVSLIGRGGILYPPRVFDEEIQNESVFTKLAPTADDIWFWAMEKRAGLKTRLTTNNGFELHPPINRIDILEPNREGSLYFINEINGKNDEQFTLLIDYYHIKP